MDLSVDLAGVRFPNPLLLGGGPGVTGETMKKAGLSGAGGVVTKTHRLVGMPQISPRIFKTGKLGLVNLEGPANEDGELWFKEEIRIAKEGGVPVVGSIIGLPEPPFEETVKLAEICEQAGADIIEYVLFHVVSKKVGYRKVQVDSTQDPEITFQITTAIRKAVSIPISIKLPPTTLDIVALAKAAEEGGASAITAINTLPNCLPGVDIERGRPLSPALGNYSGAGIKPLGLGSVARIASSVSIPVVGVGGIFTWQDALEYIMVGAHQVELCTAFMLRGSSVFGEIVNGIKQFMERKGYKELSEIRGIALPHIKPWAELSKVSLVARINEDSCSVCKRCIDSCVYGAIEFKPPEAVSILKEKCRGCGTCVQVCPIEDAISLVNEL